MNDKEILPRKTREPINLVSQEMCINDYTNNLMNKYLFLKVYNRYFLKHKILSIFFFIVLIREMRTFFFCVPNMRL